MIQMTKQRILFLKMKWKTHDHLLLGKQRLGYDESTRQQLINYFFLEPYICQSCK